MAAQDFVRLTGEQRRALLQSRNRLLARMDTIVQRRREVRLPAISEDLAAAHPVNSARRTIKCRCVFQAIRAWPGTPLETAKPWLRR